MKIMPRAIGQLVDTVPADLCRDAVPGGRLPVESAPRCDSGAADARPDLPPLRHRERTPLGAESTRPRNAKLPLAVLHTGPARRQEPQGLAMAIHAADHDAHVLLRPEASTSRPASPSRVVPLPPAVGSGTEEPRSGAGEPLARPERMAHWRRSIAGYQSVAEATGGPMPSGAAPLSPSQGRLLAELQRGIAELQALLPLLEGQAALPAGDTVIQHMRWVVTYAQKDLAVRRTAQDLVRARPDLAADRLDTFDHLASAADGLRSSIAQDVRQFGHRAPELVDYLQQVSHAIHVASRRAVDQGRVQVGILGTLRDAAQGYADADIEDRHASLRNWLGQLRLGPRAAPSSQIQHELQQSFGHWFRIDTQVDGRLSVSLRAEVVGRQSCAELVQSLDHMTRTLHSRRDLCAVRAAIAASPDVVWVRGGDGERLELTAAARARMGGGDADAAAAVPRAGLQAAVIAGAQGIDLAVLKASLMESFRGIVDRYAERARNPFNLQAGLTRAKAQLMQDLLRDLMRSPHVEDMLRLLDMAKDRHRDLWKQQWRACGGGSTEALLDDMLGCIQRFAWQPV